MTTFRRIVAALVRDANLYMQSLLFGPILNLHLLDLILVSLSSLCIITFTVQQLSILNIIVTVTQTRYIPIDNQ